MPVKRAIHLDCGGTLLIHCNGGKTYIPSKTYRESKQAYLNPKPSKSKPATQDNCSKLLDAILCFYMMKRKLDDPQKGASGWGFNDV